MPTPPTPTPPETDTADLQRGVRATALHSPPPSACCGRSTAQCCRQEPVGLHGTAHLREQNSDQKAAELLLGWQRARADYENLLRRMESELARASDAAKDQLLQGLFPIVDYFGAAMEQIPTALNEDSWTEGMRQVYQAFEGFLKDVGVTPISTANVPLDPALHEAITKEESSLPQGTVTAVLFRGYVRNGRVLRPAKVKVSAGTRLPTP